VNVRAESTCRIEAVVNSGQEMVFTARDAEEIRPQGMRTEKEIRIEL
jgi:hypothetical protein